MKKRMITLAVAAIMAMSLAVPAFAGTWHGYVERGNRWYEHSDGHWDNDGWHWIDDDHDGIAQCYYFKADGYIITDGCTPDGYYVNKQGCWYIGNTVQTKKVK